MTIKSVMYTLHIHYTILNTSRIAPIFEAVLRAAQKLQ